MLRKTQFRFDNSRENIKFTNENINGKFDLFPFSLPSYQDLCHFLQLWKTTIFLQQFYSVRRYRGPGFFSGGGNTFKKILPKILKKFLKKIAKMHYVRRFFREFKEPLLIFCAFRRKRQFIGTLRNFSTILKNFFKNCEKYIILEYLSYNFGGSSQGDLSRRGSGGRRIFVGGPDAGEFSRISEKFHKENCKKYCIFEYNE